MKMEQAWLLMNSKVGIVFESAQMAAVATFAHAKLNGQKSDSYCLVKTWIVRAKHLTGKDYVFCDGKFYEIEPVDYGIGCIDFSKPVDDIAAPPSYIQAV